MPDQSWIEEAKNNAALLKDQRQKLFRSSMTQTIEEIEGVLSRARTGGLQVSEPKFQIEDTYNQADYGNFGEFRVFDNQETIIPKKVYVLTWEIKTPKPERRLLIVLGIRPVIVPKGKEAESRPTITASQVEKKIKDWLLKEFTTS